METKYFPMNETIGFEVKSAKDIFAAKELGLFICNEEEYYFDDVVTDDGDMDREPTEDEKTERAIEYLKTGGKVFATFYSGNYMLVDKRNTTLQTDFFIGQEVFFMQNNKICKGVIFSVNFRIEKNGKVTGGRDKFLTFNLMYPHNGKEYGENEVFTSKEKLIEHLIEE